MTSQVPATWGYVAIASVAMTLVNVDTGLVSLVLPLVQQALRLDAAAALWVVNGHLLTLTLLSLPAGRWVDRAGCRRATALAFGLMGVASAGAALSSQPVTLIAWRLLHGAAAAACVPGALAMLATVSRGEAWQATALTRAATVASIVYGLMPLAGGALVDLGGWRLMFGLDAAAALAAAVAVGSMAWPFQPVPPLPTSKPETIRSSPWRWPPLGRWEVIGGLVNFGFYATFLLVGLSMPAGSGDGGLARAWTLWPLMAVLPIGSAAAGPLLRRSGAAPVLSGGAALAALGQVVLMIVLARGSSATVQPAMGDGFALGLVMVGLGCTVAVPALQAALLASTPKERAGAAVGGLNTARQCGGLLGGVCVGGLAAGAAGAGGLVAAAAAAAAALLGAALFAVPRALLLRPRARCDR